MALRTAASEIENPLTTNQKIFRAAVVVGFFSIFAKLAVTAKELVVAQWFGRGDAIDAFLIAFLLPSFVVNLVAGSFNAALIPTFIQVRDIEGRDAAQRLFSSVMVWSLGLLVCVSLLMGLLAQYYLPFLASGFGPAKLVLTRKLLCVLLPFVVISGLVIIWSSVLNAGERFALPAISPIFSPLVIVAFLALGGRQWGIYAIAWGTILGVSMEGILLGSVLKAKGFHLKPRWYGMNANMRQVAGQFIPMLAGALLMGSTTLIDQAMAAMLSPGSVAALNYANKVISALLGFGSVSLTTAVLPYFSQMVAKQDWAGCRHTVITYSRLIIMASVPLTLLLILFSTPLVGLLYQRGAFSATDTLVVSRVQALLVLQIPFYSLGMIYVRLITALKNNSILMMISLWNAVVNVVLNYVLMNSMGVAGIALSTSIVYFFSSLILTWCAWAALSKNMRIQAAEVCQHDEFARKNLDASSS